MSATIKFEGVFSAYFTKVEPYEIVLEGTKLSIQGREIPIADRYLFSALKVFAQAANNKKCMLTGIIESDGNLQYTSISGMNKADYYLSRAFSFGSEKHWKRLSPGSIPSENTEATGFLYL